MDDTLLHLVGRPGKAMPKGENAAEGSRNEQDQVEDTEEVIHDFFSPQSG